MPWDLLMAVAHACTVLRWQENLLAEEMPPEWMWPFPKELDRWFEEVEVRREARRSGNEPDDDGDDFGGMERNQLIKHQ